MHVKTFDCLRCLQAVLRAVRWLLRHPPVGAAGQSTWCPTTTLASGKTQQRSGMPGCTPLMSAAAFLSLHIAIDPRTSCKKNTCTVPLGSTKGSSWRVLTVPPPVAAVDGARASLACAGVRHKHHPLGGRHYPHVCCSTGSTGGDAGVPRAGGFLCTVAQLPCRRDASTLLAACACSACGWLSSSSSSAGPSLCRAACWAS